MNILKYFNSFFVMLKCFCSNYLYLFCKHTSAYNTFSKTRHIFCIKIVHIWCLHNTYTYFWIKYVRSLFLEKLLIFMKKISFTVKPLYNDHFRSAEVLRYSILFTIHTKFKVYNNIYVNNRKIQAFTTQWSLLFRSFR